MSRIKDYTEASTIGASEKMLLDGASGTKSITAENLAKALLGYLLKRLPAQSLTASGVTLTFKDATSFFRTYVNDTLKTSSISNIFSSGDAWGASVGKLSGNFKKGDVVKLTPLAGIAHRIKMTMIAIMEGE